MDISFHYPPELFNLMVDTIPKLVRSKQDVIIFFIGAGVENSIYCDLQSQIEIDRDSINKYSMVKTILKKLNEKGEATLRERREILKRVIEFENFSTCWENDKLPAKGLVAEIRELVNKKDSFTRMKQERDKERNKVQQAAQETAKKKVIRKQELEKLNTDLKSLFIETNPQKRGKNLEKVLNNLFSIDGILVREALTIKNIEGAGITEQIDGIVSIDNKLCLVEMKWWGKPIGVAEVSQHLSRLFLRSDCEGIFISESGFTKTAIETCNEAQAQKTIVLCTLQEIILLIERKGNIYKFFKDKITAAKIEKTSYKEILY